MEVYIEDVCVTSIQSITQNKNFIVLLLRLSTCIKEHNFFIGLKVI